LTPGSLGLTIKLEAVLRIHGLKQIGAFRVWIGQVS